MKNLFSILAIAIVFFLSTPSLQAQQTQNENQQEVVKFTEAKGPQSTDAEEETNETVISQDSQDSIAAQFNNKVREVSTTDNEEESNEALLQPFESLQPQFHTVRNDHVTEGLRAYIQQTGADLIIALPHKHNLLDALLFRLHTKDLVEQMDTPLLFLHE